MTSPDESLQPPPDDVLYETSSAASAATAHSSGPPPSSDSPEDDQEPLAQSGSDEERADEEQDPASPSVIEPQEFDPRYRDAFTGLAYIGHMEKTVTVWGHACHLVTPSQLERLQLGVIHAEYNGTLASEIAYQTLIVAAYLNSIDGTELPKPLTNDSKNQALRQRFDWVSKNMREPVIDELFGEAMKLQATVREVLKAMGEAQG